MTSGELHKPQPMAFQVLAYGLGYPLLSPEDFLKACLIYINEYVFSEGDKTPNGIAGDTHVHSITRGSLIMRCRSSKWSSTSRG